MKLADPPLPPEIWAATPSAAQALIVALQARIQELEAQLGQNSSNSSRPPSTDPPQAPPWPKAPPTGRKRGGQPGHHLVLGHPHGQRQQLHHLMSPDPATTTASGFGKRLPAVPADLRYDPHDLIHLLDRQQPAERPAVARLATALPAGGRRRRARWSLGRI